jgi:hypothetical protein
MQNKEFNYFCQILGFDWQLKDYINFGMYILTSELDFKNFTVSNQTIIDFSKCKLINL